MYVQKVYDALHAGEATPADVAKWEGLLAEMAGTPITSSLPFNDLLEACLAFACNPEMVESGELFTLYLQEKRTDAVLTWMYNLPWVGGCTCHRP